MATCPLASRTCLGTALMCEVRTSSGRAVSIDALANAEAAVRGLALNHNREFALYGATREDVEALCDLAHEAWFKKGRGKKEVA